MFVRWRSSLVACCAVALGGPGCAGLRGEPPPPGYIDVLHACEDLAAGERLDLTRACTVRIPEEFLVQGTLRWGDRIEGRVVREPVFQHELLREEVLTPGTSGPAESFRYPSTPVVGADTVMVMVAARELPPGSTIAQEDVYAVQIWPEFLPAGVYLSPEHVVGRETCLRVLANTFIRVERLQGGACQVPRSK
jgi:Flp pilus assembly protein CpaB